MKEMMTSKTTCLFMALVMLFAPLAVSAGEVFAVESPMVMDMDASMENCHEMDLSSQNGSCCDDVCQCDATGCQMGVALIEKIASSFLSITQSGSEFNSSYVSFFSPPNSPPPIA